jgi:NADP-dependent 3-hydroxy acid dehydrogenase YdfG
VIRLRAAHAIKLDVTDHASVDRLLDTIPNGFKPIDILINNASKSRPQPSGGFIEMSQSDRT